MPEFPAPAEGIAITHFIVSRDVERSRRFYTEVLGGETVLVPYLRRADGPGGDRRRPRSAGAHLVPVVAESNSSGRR